MWLPKRVVELMQVFYMDELNCENETVKLLKKQKKNRGKVSIEENEELNREVSISGAGDIKTKVLIGGNTIFKYRVKFIFLNDIFDCLSLCY